MNQTTEDLKNELAQIDQQIAELTRERVNLLQEIHRQEWGLLEGDVIECREGWRGQIFDMTDYFPRAHELRKDGTVGNRVRYVYSKEFVRCSR